MDVGLERSRAWPARPERRADRRPGARRGDSPAVQREYHGGIFDIVMGMERWTFRVVAYAGLIRDEYPPFRFDVGGMDPATPIPAHERVKSEVVASGSPLARA